MSVHPGAAAVQEDRSTTTAAGGPVDRPPYRGWQRDKRDLCSLTAYAKDPVAVLLAEVLDIGTGGFEDPQPQQSEHGHNSEIAVVGGLAGCGEQGLELQVRESERG
jgi:hypothetical protein